MKKPIIPSWPSFGEASSAHKALVEGVLSAMQELGSDLYRATNGQLKGLVKESTYRGSGSLYTFHIASAASGHIYRALFGVSREPPRLFLRQVEDGASLLSLWPESKGSPHQISNLQEFTQGFLASMVESAVVKNAIEEILAQ